MSHSGITQFIRSRAFPSRDPYALLKRSPRIPLADRPYSIAAYVRGPLVTLAVAVLFDLLSRSGTLEATPFPILVVTVVYSALSGGLPSAAVSAVVTTVDAAHFYSERVGLLRYDLTGISSLVVVGLASWSIAVVVSRLRSRARARSAREMTPEEADTIRRRLSLLEQTSTILASSLDYESTLAHVARLLVPARADWCTIHLANGQGEFRFIAGAHRDSGRELLVRALSQYGNHGPPFGGPSGAADVIPITKETLTRRADDADHLKLHRALAPVAALRVPIPGRNQSAGVLTLVIAESNRPIGEDDVELAEELAGRASLAIENAMLHREAAEAERRFRLVFGANPQPMWIFDVETLGFISVNDAAVRQYGYAREELAVMTIMDLLPRQDTLLPAPVERGQDRLEVALTRHQRKDGTIVEMELASQEIDLEGRRARLVVGTDVGDRTRALASLHQSEEHLRHSQRMDAVGRIGIGVAHDFNNVLTSIQGFADILMRDLPAGDSRRDSVGQILQSTGRGALVTRQLLAFGRAEPLRPVPLSLNALVLGLEGLIGRLAGDDIEVRTRLAEGLGTVLIDPARMEQAVLSLVLAAGEAMPAGGTMTIETSERYLGGFPAGRHLPPGRYAVLAVGDTGNGLEASGRPLDRRRRDDLGLRVVNSIVRECGGLVRITSEPGEGRTVKVYLPLINATHSLESPAPEPPPRASETVLVAEDEDGIRALLKRILSEAGYQVIEARDGPDALLTARRYDGPIHLLVTDVVMPGMSGGELAQALLRSRPRLEVLYVSGYADADVLNRGVCRTDSTFLGKPFSGNELVGKVRALLDKRPALDSNSLSERESAARGGPRRELLPEAPG